MTFDAMSNSPSFTTEYKEIWKENLVIYQKSLKAFLQAPLHLLPASDLLRGYLPTNVPLTISCFMQKIYRQQNRRYKHPQLVGQHCFVAQFVPLFLLSCLQCCQAFVPKLTSYLDHWIR